MSEDNQALKDDAVKKDNGRAGQPFDLQDELAVSQHTITLEGRQIAYTVTCGTIVLKEEADKKGEGGKEREGGEPREAPTAKASIFFVAYTRDDVEDVSIRPLTFSFNGGPGSSSVWMHLGLEQ